MISGQQLHEISEGNHNFALEEIKEERSALVAELKELVDTTPNDWDEGKEQEFDRLESAIQQLDKRKKKHERMHAHVARFNSMSPEERRQEEETRQTSLLTPGMEIRSDQKVLDTVPMSEHEDRFAQRHGRELCLGDVAVALATGQQPTETRAQAIVPDSAGGYTVPTRVAAQFVDALRARMTAMQAGAGTVILQDGKVRYAKILSDVAAGWKTENNAIAETDVSLGAVDFNAETLAGINYSSAELFQDSMNIDRILQRSFSASMARELDRVAYFGTGTPPEPQGMSGNVPAQATVGAITDWSPLVTAWQTLAEANAERPTAFVSSPKTRADLSNAADSTGQPLMRPDVLTNLPLLESTTIPDANAFMGYFGDLVLGLRLQMRLEVTQWGQAFANYQIATRAVIRCDWQRWHDESFVELTGIT